MREGATVEVEFSGLPTDLALGDVRHEEPRTVAAQDGKFTDWFGPFEAHVYRFPLPLQNDALKPSFRPTGG